MQHDWRNSTPDALARDIGKALGVVFVAVCAGALLLATVQNAALAMWSAMVPATLERKARP